ncbi:hypothetical protein FACS1894108_12310 [Planctomycetales bacterium]|nr:hypothetical protein FACS1894108_12310 [Planctomycetales bacterium]
MKTAKINDMTKGWFIGNFNPSLFKTNEVEVAVKSYQKGDREEAHYHKIATEYTAIIAGIVRMNGVEYGAGDIIVMEPHESTDFECLEDGTMNVVVKIPGANNDKFPKSASKVAFLVPIYPPHFHYANDLQVSLHKNGLNLQADLWFVFTNEQEKDEFGDYPHSIVLPEELRLFDNRGIISIKKFYGLRQIQKQYAYIIVLDAESMLIKQVDLPSICDEFFDNKILLGNEILPKGTEEIEVIKNSCKRFFNEYPNFEKLNSPLYLWFNQPCIYKTSTLDDFWDKIDYDNNIKNLQWADFDYYIYMFYLILFYGFSVEDIGIKSNFGVFEATRASLLFFKSDKYKNLPILLASPAVLHRFDNHKCFIAIQLDKSKYGVKVSVIIPVYNVETYLAECLDSVLHQTYGNLEIICVNDGSTDNSAAILAQYAERDNRIKVITRENGGLSAARNSAMAVMTGQYVLFLDSDDYFINNQVIQNCVDAMDCGYDLLCFNVEVFGAKKLLVPPVYPADSMELIVPANKYCASFSNVCFCCFKANIIKKHHIKFLFGTMFEDWDFVVDYSTRCQSIKYINEPYYFYRSNPTSLTAKMGLKAFDIFVIYDTLKNKLIARNLWTQYEEITALKFMSYILPFYNNMKKTVQDEAVRNDYLQKCQDRLKLIRPDILKKNLKFVDETIIHIMQARRQDSVNFDKKLHFATRVGKIATLPLITRPLRPVRRYIRRKISEWLMRIL